MAEFNSYDFCKKVAGAAADKKAYDILLLKIGEISIVADYFVLASGSSVKQVQAVSENIKEEMKKNGHLPLRVEGFSEGTWVLFDYGSVVVHVFHEEEREFYNIEGLWGDVLQEEYIEQA